ncbi:hypothetical protein ACFX10_021399 [Malus domestica]
MGYCNGFDVAPVGRAGGLSLWWDESVHVIVNDFSKHLIDARCILVDSQTVFRFTGVYGTSYRTEKVEFWGGMIHKFAPDNIPWICGGDFNEFLWDHEKSGGAEVRYNRTRYLEEFMSKLEVFDLGFNGPKFTWRGKRNGQLVEARLDRGLVNESWQTLWPNSRVTNGTTLGSDHSQVIVQCEPRIGKRKRIFRFEAHWANDTDCKEIVKNAWDKVQVGNSVERWNLKINETRSNLSKWSRDKFGQRSRQIQKLMDHLGQLQLNWRGNSHEIEELTKKVDRLWRQEESVWQQKSRVQWLKDGDTNTKFFHQSTIQRRRRNQVISLKNGQGNWVDTPGQIRRLIDNHFVELFTSSGNREWGDMLDCVTLKVSEEMNVALTATVSVEEIKTAAMKMGGLKAPGPDGFQGIFYQSQWDIIASDVNNMIVDLTNGSLQPLRLNATHLALIPKVQNPDSVSQFRPISLCNYSYKILSKVLANRLKRWLPVLISTTQNAFVEGRQIQDNIGIAHELFHFLKYRKTKCNFELGIKLDMHKAYDRVEWDFLMAVMEKMGFNSPKFTPSRGLRQGDPLSPYLFLLVSEVLSLLIQRESDGGRIEGIQMDRAGPMISHIFFADDTLIFLKAKARNCRNLVQVIDEYCSASGQQLSNWPPFLGWRKLGTREFIWECRPSGVDKKEAVAQAVPAYPMNLFKFPKTFCNDLDALISKFWWGQNDGENRIHWVSKEQMGKSKEEGGLGLRCFTEFNNALLAKQCWRLLSEPNSLWASVIKGRYFPNCSFFDAKRGGRASWAWSSLLVGREIIRGGAHWQIMNGKDVRVWVDKWLPSIPSGHPSPLGSVPVSLNLRVNSLLSTDYGSWEIDFLKPFLVEEEIKAIYETHSGDPSSNDRLVWPFVKNGIYSVKSGYHWAMTRNIQQRIGNPHRSALIPKQVWKCVWKLEVQPKIRSFMWRSLQEAVATNVNLFMRRSSSSTLCPICNRYEESLVHLFLQCSWVEEAIWLGSIVGLANGQSGVRNDMLSYVATTCWFIWKARCNFLFNQQPIVPRQIIAVITQSVAAFKEYTQATVCSLPISVNGLVSDVQWSPPCVGFIKINVDASWLRSGAPGFVGVVARDDEGRFMAAIRRRVTASSVAVAEALAVLHGCELGRSMGWNFVIVESDSQESISCI